MLCIKENNAVAAWKTAFLQLYEYGSPLLFNGFFRNECAAIEISDVNGEAITPLFPMDYQTIEKISTYLVDGTGESEHEWSRLYRKRLFEEHNNIEQLIELLTGWPDCPRAQVTTWKNNTDLEKASIAPCLQMLWFKILDSSLTLHVHMRTSDCYGKLLLNFNEFIAIQKYVAGRLSLKCGPYVQFVDSLHFHEKNKDKVIEAYSSIHSEIT